MADDQFAVGADQHTDRRDNAREVGLWIKEKRKMSDRPVATAESEFATARRTPADTREPHEVLGVDPDADHGVTMQSLSVEDGTGRVVFELANDASVRSFTEQFQSTYPEMALLASREDERSVQTRQSFQSGLEEELTARQAEVLRTAFFSGYFQSPRASNGRDVAAKLDIAQSTLNQHLRTAMRKLFSMLYTE